MMTVLPWIVSVVCFGLAVRYYYELWKWARQCQRAHIVIAYNRKVVLSASLVEWLGWVNQLKGQEAKGRAVFHRNHMSVSIIRDAQKTEAKTTVKTIRNNSRIRKGKVAA